MGYRLLVVVGLVSLMVGCAAFDNSSKPYEGFSDEEIAQATAANGGSNAGPLSGYYAGEMIVESNGCKSIKEKEGEKVSLSFEVEQVDNTVSVKFKEGNTSGDLKDNQATVMTKTSTAHSVYMLKFEEEGKSVSGTCEVIEADEAGQFAAPCATYQLSLQKGEKPAEKE